VTYGWPVEPFDRQHAIRGFFCDPRVGDAGAESFHFGVDVAAPDGTAVHAVAAGTVNMGSGRQNVAVIESGGTVHGYWHVVPAVRHGQRVERHALLGHVARGWGHVHLAERSGGQYWNPLRKGALTPFADHGAPVVGRIVAERDGDELDPRALAGVVRLVAEAHDVPPVAAPPPWKGLPVAPALVRWRLLRGGSDVVAWRTVADFRSTLPDAGFGRVYAAGTRQNHPGAAGLLRFLLSPAWDTRRHADGAYRLDVEAGDIRGNASRGHLEVALANHSV
jgi:hypothetical protein